MAALLLFAAFIAGCNRNSGSEPAKPTTPSEQSASPQTNGQAVPPASGLTVSDTPIKDAVEKLLTQQADTDAPFIPKGTRLLGADFKDGVASLDFSKEFGALANHGDTVESKAQHALRHALARVHGVEKMRVTVEGQPFDSQSTDWNTPFAVHEAESDADATPIDASDKGNGRQ